MGVPWKQQNESGWLITCLQRSEQFAKTFSVLLIQVNGTWDFCLTFADFFYLFFKNSCLLLSCLQKNKTVHVTSVEGSEVRLLPVCWLHGYLELGFQR